MFINKNIKHDYVELLGFGKQGDNPGLPKKTSLTKIMEESQYFTPHSKPMLKEFTNLIYTT